MVKKATPLASHDERLKEFLPAGTDFNDAVWLHKQSGMRIVKHKYLKQIAGLHQIKPLPSTVDIKYYPEQSKATCFVTVENADGQQFCSVAEADPKNNKNAYPVMMAYKRALDRAILEALNLQGFFYSDAEILLTEQEQQDFPTERAEKAQQLVQQLEKPEKINLNKAHDTYVEHTIQMLNESQNLAVFMENKRVIRNQEEFKKLTKQDAQRIALAALKKHEELSMVQAAE
tara:strand:- start:5453 stop:6145 length:693 start_codon:yes stop_codon:yes gene_type:complete